MLIKQLRFWLLLYRHVATQIIYKGIHLPGACLMNSANTRLEDELENLRNPFFVIAGDCRKLISPGRQNPTIFAFKLGADQMRKRVLTSSVVVYGQPKASPPATTAVWTGVMSVKSCSYCGLCIVFSWFIVLFFSVL